MTSNKRRFLLLLAFACVGFLCIGAVRGAAADYSEAVEHFQAGRYDEATAIAKEAVDGGIWNDRWPRLLIDCQMMTGQYPKALQTYEAAMERYRTSIALRYQGIDVLRFNGFDEEVGAAEADLFIMLQRTFGGSISRDNLVAAGRFLTDRGEDARKVLELFYDRVRSRDPDYMDVSIATAELAIRKGDFQVAADTLRPAIEIEPDNPKLHYLMALSLETGDPKAAAAAVAVALQKNPQHVDSLLFTAQQMIDREQYEEAEKTIERVLKVNSQHPLAMALLAVIANIRGQYDLENQLRAAALSTWRQNPEVDHLIGKKLSQKYRFAEGAAYQRRALEFDPRYTEASFELANDLLRLGDDTIGWQIAENVAEADPYNVVAYNLLTLRQKTAEFTVLEQDGIRVRMEQREAELYGPEVLELLVDSKRVLCKKYRVVPEKPIVVEIFPNQSDFAIRTFGLPGGAGYLGVCFGRVITANSPASQGERPANWKSVLWHEFCHVVTLEKTQNRMPRWLSEGISVYEERQRNASWGEKMTPDYRMMILGDDLSKVSELSAAFLSPKSPLHLQFAYFQSSLVVEYIIDKYGLPSLLNVLDELAAGVSINDAMTMHVGSIEKIDQQFREHAIELANQYGSLADWSRDDLPGNEKPELEIPGVESEGRMTPDAERMVVSVDEWQAWVDAHPKNYWGLRTLAERRLKDQQWSEAKEILDRMAELNVLTTERGGPMEWMAVVQRALKDENAEEDAIAKILKSSSDALPTLRRSIEMNRSKQQWSAVLQSAQQALAIQPLLPEFHAASAEASESLGKSELAERGLDALLIFDPIDPAGLRFRLAKVQAEQERQIGAKRQVLMALETAPRYRDAHRLLLELTEPADDSAVLSQPKRPGLEEVIEITSSVENAAAAGVEQP